MQLEEMSLAELFAEADRYLDPADIDKRDAELAAIANSILEADAQLKHTVAESKAVEAKVYGKRK